MATDKTFNVAGISSLNGEYKVRFANDIMRIKVLAKSGHEDIRLMELDRAMSKLEAAEALRTADEFADTIAQATIGEYLDEKTPKAVKAPVKAAKATPQVKAIKGVTPLGIKTKAELEDAPF